MADLGNLYFDILFRDKTAEQRKKLKAEITKDLQAARTACVVLALSTTTLILNFSL